MDIQVTSKSTAMDSDMDSYPMTAMPSPEESQPGSPTKALSAQSSIVALGAADPQEGTTVQELPPVDGGSGAWIFCASAFTVEMMIWGFSFRYGLLSLLHTEIQTWFATPQLRYLPRYSPIQRGSLSIHRCTLEFYTSHPPFNTASPVSIAAVGTVMLAFLYGEVWTRPFLTSNG